MTNRNGQVTILVPKSQIYDMEENYTFVGTLGSQTVSGVVTKPYGATNASGVILV